MKKITLAICIVLGIGQVSLAQTYQFKKVLDDPEFVSDRMIMTQLCGPLYFAKRTSLGWGVALDGIWKISGPISFQGAVNWFPYHLDGGLGGLYEYGGALKFASWNKVDDVKVVLSYSESSTTVGNTRTTTQSMKYLNSEATFNTSLQLHGGLQFYKTTYNDSVVAPFKSRGVYGGIDIIKKAALISEVDGQKGITSGYTRIYIDALIMPINKIDTVGQGFGLGGRIGFQSVLNPNKSKRSAEGRMIDYQVWPKLYFKTEIGIRPKEGWFFALGGGILLYKNR